jgi:hypothetical protein
MEKKEEMKEIEDTKDVKKLFLNECVELLKNAPTETNIRYLQGHIVLNEIIFITRMLETQIFENYKIDNNTLEALSSIMREMHFLIEGIKDRKYSITIALDDVQAELSPDGFKCKPNISSLKYEEDVRKLQLENKNLSAENERLKKILDLLVEKEVDNERNN